MTIGADKDSQKKMIGELLKAADRHIKTAEWAKALDEVGKALAIEPNNMYAMAYKDRINVSITEENKKAEEEKVKKLAEEKKAVEKAPEPPKEEPKPEPVKAVEPPKAEEKKPEPPKAEVKQPAPAAPAPVPPPVKDDSAARVESLRQEFATIQAKLQREVAQLTMQVKEAQALKDAVEKNLNANLASLTQELNTAKKSAAATATDTKEVDALKKEIESQKEKHKKEIESAKEIATAEMLTQIAILQKELEAAKKGSEGTSLQKQGETILMTMFHKAWQDGTITNDERALLLLLKGAIEMTEAKFGELEEGTKNEAYLNALRSVWSDGVVTPEESDFLTSLREKLSIPADEHFKLEGQIRKELKK
jgi:hypothetical protein